MNSSQPPYWTASFVMFYLREAASIHRRLPDVSVPGYRSLWPDTLHDDEWERLYERLNGRIRLGAPMPPEVTYHEAVMEWLPWIDRRQQQLVWMRANRIPWNILVDELGRSKTSLWRELRRGLAILVEHLNRTDPGGTVHRKLRGRANAIRLTH